MSIIEMIEKKGFEKGIREGEQRGEREGIRKGKIEGFQQAIVSVLEVKFGEVPDSLLQEIKKIRSLSKLNQLLEKAKIATSLHEFEKKQ